MTRLLQSWLVCDSVPTWKTTTSSSNVQFYLLYIHVCQINITLNEYINTISYELIK
jgi:hypothetical protein